jgi:chorismate mutase / prephenate dehydratase
VASTGCRSQEPRGRRQANEETPELRRLRRRIDALDQRIVRLLNERARLAIAAGTAKAAGGRRTARDDARERDVLQRVARENGGPLPQADLLAVYRRLMSATRRLQSLDRARILARRKPSSAGRDSSRR